MGKFTGNRKGLWKKYGIGIYRQRIRKNTGLKIYFGTWDITPENLSKTESKVGLIYAFTYSKEKIHEIVKILNEISKMYLNKAIKVVSF